jgi:uncharacterized membrane protein
LSEKRQIFLLVAITLVIAVAGIQVENLIGAIEGDAVVTQYTAVFHADGLLEETFIYKLNVGSKRFLPRYGEAPLSTDDLGYAQIQLLDIDVPDNTYWYFVDNNGRVHTPNGIDSGSLSTISIYAYWNEAGSYNPNFYSPGEYTVKYWCKVIPLLEHDNEYVRLNLKLAGDHIPYKNVRVEIENLGYIEELYPHPPTLQQVTDKNWYIFTGSLAENELLEFEFLLTPDALNHIIGYPRQETDVRVQTVETNNSLNVEYLVASGLYWLNKLATFLLPLGLYGLWMIYGREKDYTVPPFLSTIPNRTRKPWIVNLVFKRDATDFDKDGFHATLLDLHERGIIKIEVEDKDVVINIINDRGLDRYETKVMDFLKMIARNNVVKTEYITDMVEQAESDIGVEKKVLLLKRQYEWLISGSDNEVSGEFTVNGRRRLLPVGFLSFLLTFAPITVALSYNNAIQILQSAAVYGATTLVQVIIAVIFPTTLFGYWKDDYYREKLQWDAFKRHLTDFGRHKQYKPEDMNMWGMWLVYGTALGVGEQVAQVMQNLNIDYLTASLIPRYPYMFVSVSTAKMPSKSGGGSGGDGFGRGGDGVR